eukprot:TRINITY_DN7552_c0_g1_i2.p1 TRINITY_DN7552_c0_g1~~TRINITY_DN7552_c0_g1_i2.p1  ORF type:complete len:337 (+),score=62.36 TRINITY_DN7552_c0_g1_i2:28-1038(+)
MLSRAKRCFYRHNQVSYRFATKMKIPKVPAKIMQIAQHQPKLLEKLFLLPSDQWTVLQQVLSYYCEKKNDVSQKVLKENLVSVLSAIDSDFNEDEIEPICSALLSKSMNDNFLEWLINRRLNAGLKYTASFLKDNVETMTEDNEPYVEDKIEEKDAKLLEKVNKYIEEREDLKEEDKFNPESIIEAYSASSAPHQANASHKVILSNIPEAANSVEVLAQVQQKYPSCTFAEVVLDFSHGFKRRSAFLYFESIEESDRFHAENRLFGFHISNTRCHVTPASTRKQLYIRYKGYYNPEIFIDTFKQDLISTLTPIGDLYIHSRTDGLNKFLLSMLLNN